MDTKNTMEAISTIDSKIYLLDDGRSLRHRDFKYFEAYLHQYNNDPKITLCLNLHHDHSWKGGERTYNKKIQFCDWNDQGKHLLLYPTKNYSDHTYFRSTYKASKSIKLILNDIKKPIEQYLELLQNNSNKIDFEIKNIKNYLDLKNKIESNFNKYYKNYDNNLGDDKIYIDDGYDSYVLCCYDRFTVVRNSSYKTSDKIKLLEQLGID